MVEAPARIEQALQEQAKTVATIEYRSMAGQIEFWVRVGRAALDNPDLKVIFKLANKL